MPAPTLPTLNPSQIDDLISLARYGEIHDLEIEIKELCQQYQTTPTLLLEVARDANTGNGIVHMAAGNGHCDLLQSLLKSHFPSSSPPPPPPPKKAKDQPQKDPALFHIFDPTNFAGNTPLHYAALNGHLATVEFLVNETGADIESRNKAGLTAGEEAGRAGKEEVEAWLGCLKENQEEGEAEAHDEDEEKEGVDGIGEKEGVGIEDREAMGNLQIKG